jgi:hypothetical protein
MRVFMQVHNCAKKQEISARKRLQARGRAPRNAALPLLLAPPQGYPPRAGFARYLLPARSVATEP